MNLRDFYGKYVIVLTCNDLIIVGEVFDYYPAVGTESGEDEIDIFPNGTNHIIRVKESEIVAIKEIFLDSNSQYSLEIWPRNTIAKLCYGCVNKEYTVISMSLLQKTDYTGREYKSSISFSLRRMKSRGNL